MSLSNECRVENHAECLDSREDRADCECPCHLENTQLLCPACNMGPEYYHLRATSVQGYRVDHVNGRTLHVWCDSSYDEVVGEERWELECINSHTWPIDIRDVEFEWI